MRRRGIVMAAATLALVGGCAAYQQSKIDLAEQARRGVRMARDAAEAREEQMRAIDARQRRQLDDAFDADVFAREALSPEWIVAHRRAYAAAVDAMNQQRKAAEQSRERTVSNLEAVDRALDQLVRMQQQELKLTNPTGEAK